MGDLVVSGGGSTAVSTESMLEDAQRLGALAPRADGWLERATRLEAGILTPLSGSRGPHPELVRAASLLQRAATDCHELVHDLHVAAERYGEAERAARGRLEEGGAYLASLLGSVWAGALVALGAGAGTLGIAACLLGLARGHDGAAARAGGLERDGRAGLRALLRSGERDLTDPRGVALVRMLVSSADDAMLGALGLPFPVLRELDDRRRGIVGLHGAATVAVGVGSLAGALGATGVAVRRATAGEASAPSGYAALAQRVPYGGAGAPQVRIERYADPGGGRPRWIVYVGGTVDGGFVPKGEPWDDTSNLRGEAGLHPASLRATREAMRAAGIRTGDEVVAVGYSQGGIVATDLARDGEAGTLVTFGSPTAGAAVPATVPDVAVEHTDDVIPALGGEPRTPEQGGLQRVLVRQRALAPDSPARSDPLGAHHLPTYVATARDMDSSVDSRLRGVSARIDALTGSGPARVTTWRATRTPAEGER